MEKLCKKTESVHSQSIKQHRLGIKCIDPVDITVYNFTVIYLLGVYFVISNFYFSGQKSTIKMRDSIFSSYHHIQTAYGTHSMYTSLVVKSGQPLQLLPLQLLRIYGALQSCLQKASESADICHLDSESKYHFKGKHLFSFPKKKTTEGSIALRCHGCQLPEKMPKQVSRQAVS